MSNEENAVQPAIKHVTCLGCFKRVPEWGMVDEDYCRMCRPGQAGAKSRHPAPTLVAVPDVVESEPEPEHFEPEPGGPLDLTVPSFERVVNIDDEADVEPVLSPPPVSPDELLDVARTTARPDLWCMSPRCDKTLRNGRPHSHLRRPSCPDFDPAELGLEVPAAPAPTDVTEPYVDEQRWVNPPEAPDGWLEQPTASVVVEVDERVVEEHERWVTDEPDEAVRLGIEQRKCRVCEGIKPVEEFYDVHTAEGRTIRKNTCRDCENAAPRNVTLNRTLRNRAYQRALSRLAEEYPERMDELKAEELEKAKAEAEALGEQDGAPALLRPGRRRDGQTVVERIDVARCRTCHTNHDRGHRCPTCGSTEVEA